MGDHRLPKSPVDKRKHFPLEGLRPQESIPDQDGVTAPLEGWIGHEVIEDGPLHDVTIATERARALAGLAKATNDERKISETLLEVVAQPFQWHDHIRVSAHCALL